MCTVSVKVWWLILGFESHAFFDQKATENKKVNDLNFNYFSIQKLM